MTLGQAAPTSWHSWSASAAAMLGVDADYSYPRALARQYAPADPAFADGTAGDVSAAFNSDASWWFPSDGDAGVLEDEGFYDDGDGRKAVKYDFEQIALHEMLHGLGFISSWYPWTGTAELLPSAPVYEGESVEGLSRPFIFNRWMADAAGGAWMREHEATIVSSARASAANNMSEWAVRFAATEGAAVAKALYAGVATTPGALRIWYPAGRSLELRFAILYTPSNFSVGSSISHLDDTFYGGTGQFLMRPYATGFGILDNIVPRRAAVGNEGPGPMGETVLGILRALGYSTALGPLG
ncbi:hypothetical protein BDK51DRAFT_45285 [Blyttiomyces helicus]|uniref:Uncharacterized protein n=1 Tax=Blyttiomyces helicus TaxID=388810 RepID=A0A4P9WIT9_9FUNG|nr:hypothetical protein BDK51DRAFT_45285 [Blyttiomyces helicus]|eukprot:RKO91823.1 hypothetical protein BDK51DRAFT_45285 [Blyttiomyces helicus]